MRKPVVAGQFYPASKEELNKQIMGCFKNLLGAGMPKVPLKEKRIYGAVVPHAGYVYSGACASWAYKELGELNKKSFPDTFIFLGPNHRGYSNNNFALSYDDFETPFGIINNDTELGVKLIEETEHLGLSEDNEAHKYEHSLEVQIPFLQFISRMLKKEPKIIPILISTLEYDKLLAFGRKIAKIIQEQEKQEKRVCIIASSDFTHYGQNYGFFPFPESEARERLKELDRKSINHILKLSGEEFYKEATKTTICGTGAMVVLIEACKALGAEKASLLKYYTSGDIVRDYSNAVGYASLIVE